ncbi:hypothetical protein [Streptomyces sp. HUAS TT7]
MENEEREEWTDPRYAELVENWQRAQQDPEDRRPARGFLVPQTDA